MNFSASKEINKCYFYNTLINRFMNKFFPCILNLNDISRNCLGLIIFKKF